MSRTTKKKLRKKQVNILAMESSCRKYMREQSLFRDEFKRQENINKLLEKPKRLHRPRYISR